MSRYKAFSLAVTFLLVLQAHGQELFVYSEPASNMPAKSMGIRLSNWLMSEQPRNRIDYHLLPEIMIGVNNRLMLHAEGFFGNTGDQFSAEGAGMYAKYRFLSRDHVYRHFRMAAFVRVATNNSIIYQEDIAINGYNTGYEAGIITTQLLHKTALSLTVSEAQAYDNSGGHGLPMGMADQALNYSLSAGRLLLPKKYTSYNQINLNIMAELIAQLLPGNGKQYLDIAPSVQLIFNSQTRLDVGYRHELYSNMSRLAPNGSMVRVEHLLFNVVKRR